MRTLIAIILFASTAHAEPTTQACLGDLTRFLTCPPDAHLRGTLCWSAGGGHGPAYDTHPNGTLRSAGYYLPFANAHGRVFTFDTSGVLKSWVDMRNGEEHGLWVECSDGGHVTEVSSWAHGEPVGLTRTWDRDGKLWLAFAHDGNDKFHDIQPTPAQRRRPDELCHPRVCDVRAAPDLSGVPPALR
jgi:hypothetical protein